MNAIRHKNLQELCRACLKSLKNTNTEFEDNIDANKNNLLIPNLCQLFRYFTTLDVTKEIECFPKLLCQLCLTKLMEYDDFRKLALRSTSTLYEVLNGREKTTAIIQKKVVEGAAKTEKESGQDEVYVKMEKDSADEQVYIKTERNYDDYEDEDDDDQLLLPELANMPLNIKTEHYFEATDTQLVTSSIVEEGEIKEKPPYKTNWSEDDADDEELFLSNGAINTSSPSIYTTEGGNLPKCVALTKRDRKQKKSLYCSTCNKQFYKQFYLDAHVRGVHMGEKEPFQCLICFKSFTSYNQLYMHKRSQHTEDDKDVAEYKVNETYVQLDDPLDDDKLRLKDVIPRTTELDSSGDYTCEICSRNYSSRRALNEHLKRHQQIKEHVCKVCGVAKVTRTELQTHMRVHIPNLEKFPCPQCPQVFNHKNAISRHVKVVHQGQKRFPCAYCPKRFSTRNSKVCHERLHTGERPFNCDICHKGFVQQESLRSHMKNHDKTLRKHVCSHCSQRFITLKNLMDHEKRHLGSKPHICNVCSKGFYKDEDLQAHRASHGNDDGSDGTNNVDDQRGDFSDLEQPTDSGSQSSN